MSIDSGLIAAILRDVHGRSGVDEQTLTETAERLTGLVGKVRLADETALANVGPAISFNPGSPSYATSPVAGPAAWEAMATTPGGTGYGGKGTTGSAYVEARPRTGHEGPDFLFWSASEMADAIRRRDLSPVELTRACIERISAVDASLNAFVTVMGEEAMAEARRAEAEREPRGPLHGVPVALKDLYEVAGYRTTGGSRVLADYVSKADAPSVTRLKQAGAIIIGKTATHEFAFGAVSDSPYHGPVRNPWDTSRTPGGSSGGSGAAVAAGMVPIAMGSDTGGSIRMPAAHCGIVGLKPTYGRSSKAGVLPLSWSLDHIGPLCVSVKDAATVLAIIAGHDASDPTTVPVSVDDYISAAVPGSLKGLRVGIPVGWVQGRVDPEVLARFEDGLDRFRELGAQVVEVELPDAGVMTLVNRLITLAEAGAYHAPLLRARAADYAPDVRQRLELGMQMTARDYLLGLRLRGELARQVSGVMATVDVVATPTMPVYPARIGQPLWEYPDGWREPVVEAMVRFPAPISVSGNPAFSLPCGFTDGGLPVGLQLIGRPFGEVDLIRVAASFEAAGGPLRRPAV